MAIDNVEITLAIITFGTISLVVSIYVGSKLLKTLTAPKELIALRLPRDTGQIRRGAATMPGIICSLPIFQQSPRHEILPPI